MRDKRSRLIDAYLGINTISIPVLTGRNARFPDSVHYEAPDYVRLWLTIRHLVLRSEDVVYEVGCGMGRVLCIFARRRVRRVIGIEICPELAKIASQNASRVRGSKSPVEVRVADAADTSYDEGTIYFFFNPFGAETLACVLEQIRESLVLKPRAVRIVYMHPIHEAVLEQTGWLRCICRIKHLAFCSGTSIWEGHEAG